MFLSRSKQILVFLIVLLIWGAAPIVVWVVHGDWPASAGEYGDLFGGVGALFSGLAFAGLIGTLVMQREALAKQSEELVLTRDSVEQQTKELSLSSEALQLQVNEMMAQRAEMEASRETLEQQQAVMAKQAFEGTFFQMLKLWNDRVGEIASQLPTSIGRQGRANFHEFHDAIGEWGQQSNGSSVRIVAPDAAEVYNRFPVELQTYFMLLYNLIAFVDNANLADADKKSYVRLIRAHLVDDEMVVLLYNCVGAKGRGLGMLAYKYHLFRYLLPETKKTHAKAWDLFRSEFGKKAV
ncbi:putative phage abortive infection protein [Aliiroseovarius crassostreae]|uniref:Phage abortive infection protein n=1 Tax=Aliiroseovarius crassostreae TaxID=154981 RepID=A0A9Q9H663_9RHOB|nr:putative phage abortive infection protein [Aliiroseovarius crassostreae]UWP91096.1 putative phage abortive infection protein [Aliiroseovarius crassostreae]UWP94284.1 putative phage abortive infection protein [Aliiroseovarius crassostreae]UWQ00563.1 putative phage abortive infection protein [Aliiroseovarius crassostreae]